MTMVDLSSVKHNHILESIVDALYHKTRKTDRQFLRVVTAYYMCVVAACMRTNINVPGRGKIPVNGYTLALAPSGYGKGHTTFLLENVLLKHFRDVFRDHIMPAKAEQHMWALASKRAATSGTEDQDEFDKLAKELASTGEYPFVFDGGSESAIKQIRQMLLLSNCGSINLQVDEIGLNLEKSKEALTAYLELYDQGLIKPKLLKNVADNKRGKEIEGKTPANMLLFGAPSKLFDGAMTEKTFYGLLETGYARRCFFAHGRPEDRGIADGDIAEAYKQSISPINDGTLKKWSVHMAGMADLAKFDWTVEMPDEVGLELFTYQTECEAKADALPEHAELQKAELTHRYFKALKLAGAFAFMDECLDMSLDHLRSAIKLVEDSGNAFEELLTREAPYMKLARYIATVGTEVTHADLLEALPFYKSSQAARQEMVTMATAWGYKQHIMVKKSYVDGIEFFSGETLEETNLDEMIVSYSGDFAHGYRPERAPFDKLNLLTQAEGLSWCSHHFQNDHRLGDNVIPGFNMIVLDIDGGTTLDQVHELMEEFTFMTYTTKRHSEESHRFRLILPMNYVLCLDKEDHREFMQQIIDWVPFEVDACSKDQVHKWLSNPNGKFHFNEGDKLFDVLPFVPKTSKNEAHQKELTKLADYDSLERWFAQRFTSGNRNNLMIKFALALVDSGLSYPEVERRVLGFNEKLDNGLSDTELRSTVMVTVARRQAGDSV